MTQPSMDRIPVRFGVAGNPPNFWASAYKKDRGLAPAWLRQIGLEALEIQCTYGVRMPDSRAALFHEQATAHDIALSVHAPYYITLGTDDPQKRANSLRDLTKAIDLAHKLGSRRVIFHPGSSHGDRPAALARAIEALQELEAGIDFGGVELFPEIAGKEAGLGSLDDILVICSEIRAAWPCLDLAHLHARENGSLGTQDDFERVLDAVTAALGTAALDRLHFHTYPVTWGPKGERSHVPFDADDLAQLPDFRPFVHTLIDRSLTATVICEARDSQDIGALAMQAHYLKVISS